MSYHRLGQLQTQLIKTNVTPLYTSGVSFNSRINTGQPGQLYPMVLDPVAVEKEIYKDVPTTLKEEAPAVGTNPQKIIKTKSGLEVPAYILDREIARRQESAKQEEAIRNKPLPRFHKIGVMATKKPAQTLIYALILGYISGQLFYSTTIGS